MEALNDIVNVIHDVLGPNAKLLIDGVMNLPRAQAIGIAVGTCVFLLTIATVIYLLIAGGSLQRITDQDKAVANGEDAVITNAKVILDKRPSLYDDLVMARRIMMEEQKKSTSLTSKMSSNSAPSKALFKSSYLRFQSYHVTYSVHVPGRPNAGPESFTKSTCSQIPPFFSSSIPSTLKNHSRSYGRVYTALATKGVKEYDTMEEIFKTYPKAMVGTSVIVVPYEAGDEKAMKMAEEFAFHTSGHTFEGHPSYDPSTVWGFLPSTGGPFLNPKDVHKSSLFSVDKDSAVLMCLDSVTRKCIGVIKLSDDQPEHLSIKLDCGVWAPTYKGKLQEVEAGYLALGKLFAMGYRRVEYECDVDDSDGRKMGARLGFSPEGERMKDVLIEIDSETIISRNSNTFALLNSDWNGDNGARNHVFAKIYGSKALKVDKGRRKEDDEDDNELRLAEQRKEEEERRKKEDTAPSLISDEEQKKKN